MSSVNVSHRKLSEDLLLNHRLNYKFTDKGVVCDSVVLSSGKVLNWQLMKRDDEFPRYYCLVSQGLFRPQFIDFNIKFLVFININSDSTWQPGEL